MGRKPLFEVKSLKIGEKLPFPKRKVKYIYQYLNNFNRFGNEKFNKVEEDGRLFIERVL